MSISEALRPPQLLEDYLSIRAFSESLIETLSSEDCALQAMDDTSPPKWHLAHTTWFYETFLLSKFYTDYKPFKPEYTYLFNSYYNQVGEQFSRPNRHLLSRPSLSEVLTYRHYVDDAMGQWIRKGLSNTDHSLLQLGLNHEQQHQELLLMDIKYSFFQNPLLPTVCNAEHDLTDDSAPISKMAFERFNEGLYQVGSESAEFCYDNETPAHKTYLPSYELSNRLVTNGEYLDFINQGGYQDARYWLSDGWAWLKQAKHKSPLYWVKKDQAWHEFTLHGLQILNLNQPVCHVSFYEADAYARYCGARLPTEQEWEVAAKQNIASIPKGQYANTRNWHPRIDQNTQILKQLFGYAWEWTSSPYSAYPGFKQPPGAVGEYNGKFMCNQMVLKGGSCLTPNGHVRTSYRNFFYPKDRWPLCGIRLARNT